MDILAEIMAKEKDYERPDPWIRGDMAKDLIEIAKENRWSLKQTAEILIEMGIEAYKQKKKKKL